METPRKLTLKGNEIITIDLNIDKMTVNWAIKGIFLSNENISCIKEAHVAFAASIWRKDTVSVSRKSSTTFTRLFKQFKLSQQHGCPHPPLYCS